MNEFRSTLKEFRDLVHQEAELNGSPGLQVLLMGGRPQQVLQLRWAATAAMVLVLAGLPAYRTAQDRQRQAEQERADALLLEQVNSALSQSVPRAMASLAMVMDAEYVEESR